MGMCHITALLKSFGISKKEKQTKFLFLRNPMPTPFPHEIILDLAVVCGRLWFGRVVKPLIRLWNQVTLIRTEALLKSRSLGNPCWPWHLAASLEIPSQCLEICDLFSEIRIIHQIKMSPDYDAMLKVNGRNPREWWKSSPSNTNELLQGAFLHCPMTGIWDQDFIKPPQSSLVWHIYL